MGNIVYYQNGKYCILSQHSTIQPYNVNHGLSDLCGPEATDSIFTLAISVLFSRWNTSLYTKTNFSFLLYNPCSQTALFEASFVSQWVTRALVEWILSIFWIFSVTSYVRKGVFLIWCKTIYILHAIKYITEFYNILYSVIGKPINFFPLLSELPMCVYMCLWFETQSPLY